MRCLGEFLHFSARRRIGHFVALDDEAKPKLDHDKPDGERSSGRRYPSNAAGVEAADTIARTVIDSFSSQ